MTRIEFGSRILKFLWAAAVFVLPAPAAAAAPGTAPALGAQGTTKQVIVDGTPFLMLGGELGKSTASSSAAPDAVWPKV